MKRSRAYTFTERLHFGTVPNGSFAFIFKLVAMEERAHTQPSTRVHVRFRGGSEVLSGSSGRWEYTNEYIYSVTAIPLGGGQVKENIKGGKTEGKVCYVPIAIAIPIALSRWKRVQYGRGEGWKTALNRAALNWDIVLPLTKKYSILKFLFRTFFTLFSMTFIFFNDFKSFKLVK